MVGQIDRCSVADPDPEDQGLFELRGPDPVYLGPDPPHCLAPTGSEIQWRKNIKSSCKVAILARNGPQDLVKIVRDKCQIKDK